VTDWATDKVQLGYLPTYRRIQAELAARHRHDPTFRPSVLEVGVASGGGMAMLSDVFDTGDVWGVDQEPKPGLTNVIQSAQDHPGLGLRLMSEHGPFDLVVDDASHMAGPTAETLANLWILVRPGGWYVIEDWNLWDAEGNASNLWQKIIGPFMAYPVAGDHKPNPPYSGMLPDVESVTITNGLIVIRKRQS